jgi:transcription elongation factor Elf1
MVDVSSALTSARFVSDSLRALLGLAIDAKALQQVSDAISRVAEVQGGILECQQTIGRQEEEIRTLRRELEAYDQWKRRSEGYALFRTKQRSVVYQFIGEPRHFACPTCFENRIISPLQESSSEYSGLAQCPRCAARYEVADSKPIRAPSSEWNG